MRLKMSMFKCFIALLAVGCVLLNSPLMYASECYSYNVVTNDYQTQAYTVGKVDTKNGAIHGDPYYGGYHNVYYNKNNYKTIEYSIYKINVTNENRLGIKKASTSSSTGVITPNMPDDILKIGAYRVYYGVVRKGGSTSDIGGSVYFTIYADPAAGIDSSKETGCEETLSDEEGLLLQDESGDNEIIEQELQ